MSAPIYDDQLNKILLKPRFKIEAREGVDELINKFRVQLKELRSLSYEKKSITIPDWIIDNCGLVVLNLSYILPVPSRTLRTNIAAVRALMAECGRDDRFFAVGGNGDCHRGADLFA